MNAPANIRGVQVHCEFDQGSDAWLQARCGLLTASELDRIIHVVSAKTVREYRVSGKVPEKLTAKRIQALGKIGERKGSMRELAFLAGVSDGVLRDLLRDGALEAIETHIPATTKVADDERERAHLWEMAAQRITRYVEPQYWSDSMLRGQEDEIKAREDYSKTYAPVQVCGLVTNNTWGFTIGCSPDGLVGDEGMIECKSRGQKFQVQTICEYFEDGTTPDDFTIQVQGQLLVTGRKWCDLISRCGGLHQITMRVEPDEAIQAAILDAAAKFEARINEVVAIYQKAIKSDLRLIPTERTIEQAMYI